MRQFKTKRLFVFGLMLMIILGFAVGAAENCVQPPSDLLSWWAGEGNADPVGKLMNGATFSPGKAGQAFSFDGVDDYLAVPSKYILGGDYRTIDFKKDSFSFVAWIKTSTENANTILFAKCPHEACDYGSDGAAYFGISGGKLYFTFEDHALIKGKWVVTKDMWHLAVVTSDANTNEVKLYLDTFFDGGASAEPDGLGQEAEIHIGGHPGWSFFKGEIDEVSIYNRALSAEEIIAIFAAKSAGKCGQFCAPAPSGLIGWWQGEENANDILNKNNGFFPANQYHGGKVGTAFSMMGNSYIEIPDSEDFAVSDITIEAWVRPVDISEQRTIASKYNFKSQKLDEQSWYFQTVNGYLKAGIEAQADSFIIQANAAPLSKDVWQHVAIVYGSQDKRLELYVDGKKIDATINSIKLGYSALKASKTPLLIGAIFSEGKVLNDINWKGDMDEVSIYNRALSADEIKALYDAGSAGKCKAPECGNGKVEEGENCDDKNKEANDGCVGCQLESKEWSCIGEPSACVKQAPQPPGGSCVSDLDCSEGNKCIDTKCMAKSVPKEGICGDLDQLQPTDKSLATEIINALKNNEYSTMQKLNAIVMALKEWYKLKWQ